MAKTSPVPLPVVIAPEQEPVPVVSVQPEPVVVPAAKNMTLQPTTTLEQDKVTDGQRRVNLVWELTQAVIAVLITAAVVYCAITRISSQDLTNSFFLIVGFYFARTNHQAIGGIGVQQQQPYIGR